MKNVGVMVNKLSDRSTKMVMVGYEPGTKGYCLFDPQSNSYVSVVMFFLKRTRVGTGLRLVEKKQ